MARSRPGAVPLSYSYTAPIQGGLGAIGGGLILIHNDSFNVTPVFWAPGRPYLTGDLVWHNGDLWEAQEDNIGSAPSPGSTIWVWSFIGGSCTYSLQVNYDIGDGVCEEDPVTGQLYRTTARSKSSKSFPPSIVGWKKHLWKRGTPGTDRYWVGGDPATIGDSAYSASAAYLVTGAGGSFPRSGVDDFGRSWTETIDDADYLPTGYITVIVFQPNPPYDGGIAYQSRDIVVEAVP